MSEIVIPTPPFYSVIIPNWISEIGPEVFQLFLLLLAAIWLAHRLAADFAFQLYNFDHFKQAVRMVIDVVLPFRRRPVILQKGEVKAVEDLPAKTLYGGRISVQMDAQKGYAAALEDLGNRILILGPQDVFPNKPSGFLRLREIVDLSDQQVEITVAAMTKDGIPVVLRDASFICSLRGSLFDNRKSIYQSCDKRGIRKLVYHHWIGQDWENPIKRQKALRDLVSTALQDFLFQHTLIELLAEYPGLVESIQQVRLNRPLLERFTQHFNEKLDEHGLQLVWTGKCDWYFHKAMDMDIVRTKFPAAYSDWIRSQREIQLHTGIQILRDETGKLVRQLLKLAENLRKSGETEDTIVLELAQHYAVRIQNAIRLIESRGDRVPKEWITVSDHLNHILN